MSFGTLADFKAWAASLDIDFSGWDDTQLQGILDSAMDWIEAYCNRQFVNQNYVEKYNGDGSDVLVLRQYPITTLNSIKIGTSQQIFNLAFGDFETDEASAIIYASQLRTGFHSVWPHTVWPEGRQNITVDYDAGFTTIPRQLIDVERKVALVNLIALNPEEFERQGIRTERVGDHSITFQRGDAFRAASGGFFSGQVLTRAGQLITTWETQLKVVLDRFKKLGRFD